MTVALYALAAICVVALALAWVERRKRRAADREARGLLSLVRFATDGWELRFSRRAADLACRQACIDRHDGRVVNFFGHRSVIDESLPDSVVEVRAPR